MRTPHAQPVEERVTHMEVCVAPNVVFPVVYDSGVCDVRVLAKGIVA